MCVILKEARAVFLPVLPSVSVCLGTPCQQVHTLAGDLLFSVVYKISFVLFSPSAVMFVFLQ